MTWMHAIQCMSLWEEDTRTDTETEWMQTPKDKGIFYCVKLYLIPFVSLNNRELLASTGLLGFQDLRYVLAIQQTVRFNTNIWCLWVI